jgi:hypothetical protein
MAPPKIISMASATKLPIVVLRQQLRIKIRAKPPNCDCANAVHYMPQPVYACRRASGPHQNLKVGEHKPKKANLANAFRKELPKPLYV